jgi:hypothetical protein
MRKLLFCGGVCRKGPSVVIDTDERSATVRHGSAATQEIKEDISERRRECCQWLSC